MLVTKSQCQQNGNVIIDVGALFNQMTNIEVARYSLELTKKQGAIYFD